MPHLYLPAEHTDADLVLAGQVAELIDSAELYVTWTPTAGHAAPAVPAVMREPSPRGRAARPARARRRRRLPRTRRRRAPRARTPAPAPRGRAAPAPRPPQPTAAHAARRATPAGRAQAASACAAVAASRPRAPRRPPRPRAAWRPRAPTARRTRRATCRPRSASSASRARNDLPERPLKPVTGFAVRPVAISSRATASGSVLPALLFQITKPQPGSSRDQHEKPLRFSTMSWPQTGHGPRLARGMRTSLSLASSSLTVPPRELGDVAHEALARLLARARSGRAGAPSRRSARARSAGARRAGG